MNRRIVLALLAGAVSGCGGEEDEPPIEYIAAKQRWSAAAHMNYHFTLTRSCFCLAEGPIEVQVRQGAIASARFSDSGTSVSPLRLAALMTLSGLFDLADSAYAQKVAAVRFSAHPTHGYLESLFIDYHADTADDEIGYAVMNFAVDTISSDA